MVVLNLKISLLKNDYHVSNTRVMTGGKTKGYCILVKLLETLQYSILAMAIIVIKCLFHLKDTLVQFCPQ